MISSTLVTCERVRAAIESGIGESGECDVECDANCMVGIAEER